MLTEYVEEALRRARYELIEDEETPYYGEVLDLPGVWACGPTLEACRQELKDVIEGWILLGVRQSLDIPPLGDGGDGVNRNLRRPCAIMRSCLPPPQNSTPRA